MQADLIIHDGLIRTMDDATPTAEAVVVSNGKIMAVGSNADMLDLAGSAACKINLNGKLLLPGFQDTHMHFQLSSNEVRLCAALAEYTTAEQVKKAMTEFYVANPDAEVIWGSNWNAGMLNFSELTRQSLDEICADKPIILIASDHHNGWVNTAALKMLGMMDCPPETYGDHIVREADGTPSGLLFESAAFHLMAVLESRPASEIREAMKWGCAELNKVGFTGVLDALVTPQTMDLYHQAEQANELTLRVASTALVKPDGDMGQIEMLKEMRAKYNSPMVKTHSAKFFIDGVMENKTALLLEPYADGTVAPALFEKEFFEDMIVACDREKFQVHVHGLGDGAARMTLDAFEKARKVNGEWNSLHQIAHLQLVDPADVPRFKELGVVANFQPLWACMEPTVQTTCIDQIGPDRSEWIYPLAAIIDTGAPYAISSDWCVSTYEPMPIMQTALTRQDPWVGRYAPVLTPQHRIDIDTAVKGYTIRAAEAAWNSDIAGSITPGKCADMVIFDQDLYEIDPYDLINVKTMATFLEGNEVYRNESFDG
ncbi:MAG: amidohydrolase [Rhodospirillales bacterium]|jgi:predicted amidohydrolase YtcJ|nr:amidohydrolase [Rhodospirillales bacterium]